MSQVICERCGEEITILQDLFVARGGHRGTAAFHTDCYGSELLDGRYRGFFGRPQAPVNGLGRWPKITRLIVAFLIAFAGNIYVLMETPGRGGLSLLQIAFEEPVYFLPLFFILPTITAVLFVVEITYVNKSWHRYERHFEE